MAQVDPDQIVGNKAPANPVKPIPRDFSSEFAAATETRRAILSTPIVSDPTNPFQNDHGSVPSDAVSSQAASMPVPQTPALLSIKSQTISIKEDGTATVDVILEVEGITGVTEYEVRIAKDARNL